MPDPKNIIIKYNPEFNWKLVNQISSEDISFGDSIDVEEVRVLINGWRL